jgi:phosphoglycerol transferase MdoB-like AlkP superfamily enzyme
MKEYLNKISSVAKRISTRICLARLSLLQAIIFLAGMSLALTLFMFLLQPISILHVGYSMLQSWGLNLFLNWLPVFLLMLFLYFTGMGAANACTVVGFLGIAMGFANRTKILLRNDPLTPWDLQLANEVMGIIHSFGTGFIVMIIFGVILYIFVAVAGAFVVRSKPLHWKWRAAGMVGCLLFAVIFNRPLYANYSIHQRIHITGNIWHQVNQFNSRGWLYSFIYMFNTNRVMRPEGYNPDYVRERIAAGDTSGRERLAGQELPHIIMIQGEAFSELSMLDVFCFEGFIDPLENWQAIIPEGIHGEIMVSVHGGGTAQTEFDILTGLDSRQFPGVPFAFRMITHELESMATLLNSLGYRSEFMHPGFDWFYNRRNVYPLLGFERTVFMDAFEGIPTRSGYVSEYATFSRVLEMFAEHRESFPNVPYFHFCVTIQNHGPYVDKFRWDGFEEIPNFNTTLDLIETDINALSNYFHGIKDTDREFRRIVDYFSSLSEPVVLIYFSDHMPAFNPRIYDALLPNIFDPGSIDDLARLFRVPFLIWLNDAALEMYGVSHPQELVDPAEELFFSAPFFGAYVMEMLGLTNLSPFWDFNMQLRRKFPIITEARSFNAHGEIAAYLSSTELAPLTLYRHWSYFRLFDE